jgi:hypothetical protein
MAWGRCRRLLRGRDGAGGSAVDPSRPRPAEDFAPMPPRILRRSGKNSHRVSIPMKRDPSYYLVAGVALEQEMERLRALETFAGGRLASQRPLFNVRRARKRPNRLGFAVPDQFRLSVSAYPGIRRGDVLETLIHELVHLHLGRTAEAHAWHGRAFKITLAAAMNEAYGIAVQPPSSTHHGVYAEAIERLHHASRPPTAVSCRERKAASVRRRP